MEEKFWITLANGKVRAAYGEDAETVRDEFENRTGESVRKIKMAPYPFCYDPACARWGYCRKDPACSE